MKIAVQENLEEIKKYLVDRGYEVVSPAYARGAEAMIVTGENASGEEKPTYTAAVNPVLTTYAPVINAEGKSPVEILSALEKITGLRTK